MRARPTNRRWLAVLLAGALAFAPITPAAAAQRGPATVTEDADSLTVQVKRTPTAPGYTLDIAKDQLRMTTTRGGKTVLASTGGDTGTFRFLAGGTWHRATKLTGWSWQDGVLRITAGTTTAGTSVELGLTPQPDRYALSWDVRGATADQVGLVYDLRPAGHWYGHGEARTAGNGPYTDQPWPLENGRIRDQEFGPASYEMVDPFWYTSSAAGLWVDTGEVMDVGINDGGDGLGRFTIAHGGTYKATVFVEDKPLEVYRDYVGIVGKPAKSDAPYEQYAKPMWNSWAQFYTNIDQAKMLDYVEKLHANKLPGHTIQLDDKWESNYGNLTFDSKTFPDPRGLSDRIHELGFDFGIWVTLWINLDSANYQYAVDKGYLLMDRADPAKPCQVTWWNGNAGIIDLANPAAKSWYENNLRDLMAKYRVDGFKFDTRFFDDRCAPREGNQRSDYQRLGVEMADQFDLQGAGIRVHWNGAAHQSGLVIRQVDKGTGWDSLAASVSQNLAISTVGYPFVETDMIGGSLGQPPPTKEVLVRWAQSASLMPMMYSSTSPVETFDKTTGQRVTYDQETIDGYRAAAEAHERLAPYIWDQVQASIATGDPIMRPLFFDFPGDQPAYTVDDQWMLGPAVLAAPKLTPGTTRDVFLPTGSWFDVNHGTVVRGPRILKGYATPLGVTPAFVNLRAPGADKAIQALKRDDVPAAGVRLSPDAVSVDTGKSFEVTTSVTNWEYPEMRDVRTELRLPEGWQAVPKGQTTARLLAYGRSLDTTWSVAPGPGAAWGRSDLGATASYRDGSGPQQATETVPVDVKPVPGEIRAPYRTHATTEAKYAQGTDQFAIWADGQDLSGWKDEKGVVYLDDGAPDRSTVATHVTAQNGTRTAKAGLALANDLTTPSNGGYAVLTVSPQWGVEFLIDANGDGVLDTHSGSAGATYTWLRLTRDGTTYTASVSYDGKAWSQIGTAQVPSANGTGDAGIVASAVNANHPGESTMAVFNGFSVAAAGEAR